MSKIQGKVLIAVIALLTCFSIYPIQKLTFEFNFEKFFPAGDPDVEFFQNYKKLFHTEIDDEYIFIGLKNNKGIFDKTFLEKADSLSRFIEKLDHILRVYSVTHTGYVYVKDNQLQEGPVIHISQPELYAQDSIDLFTSEEYRSLLISKDGKSIAITAFNSPNLSDTDKDRLLGSIRKKIDDLTFEEAHLTAKIRIERTYVNEIIKNLKIYLVISFALIAIVLLMVYRSTKEIVIPFLTIIISICWMLALISLMHRPLDILSSLIPPVLAVICLSNVIHISTKYIEELRKGTTKLAALKIAFREIGLATFFASLTTAVGFYSLAISNINPIRSFGLFAGTGVLIAFIVATLFVIAAYANSHEPHITHLKYADQRWERFLTGFLRLLIRRRYWVLTLCLVTVPLSFYFINKIQANSSMLQEIPKNHPILRDYEFMEEQFAGTRPFELALILKDTNQTFLNLDILQQVEQVENFLKDSCGVGFMISPVTFIKGGYRAFKGGGHENYKLPRYQNDVYYIMNRIMFTGWGKDLVRFLTLDGKHARIGGKLPDLTTKEFNLLSKRFNHFFERKKDVFDFSCKITGSAVLIDKVSDSLIGNMLSGLLITFLVIVATMLIISRSIKMVLIGLVPNIISLLIMAAAMGILGIYLKADTSIIFAVAIGIAVDDTLHFINRFKLELSKGKSVAYAVKRTYLSTGKAMVIATFVLLAGFTVLLFSSFGGTFYIGLLVSLCLVVALLTALSVLSLLILLFIKK